MKQISRLGLGARDALSEGAALAQRIPGFVARPAQQRLAMAVADAFEHRGVLLAEAGTGTGKTFAYLVPALLSGMKTIVSTGTRALQDQLYFRDLPRVRDALGTGLKTALLKGRANYLCRYRLEQTKGDARFSSRELVAQFQRVVAWSGRTQFGDMSELDALPEDSPLLPQVTSTADNCLGTDCPFWGDCFVVQARQRAQTADIVVVNHHLLLADLALKQEGFGEILPGAQAFVVDEAHQLPELAAQFFGEGLGARPLVELARDAIAECKDVPGALASVQEPARALEQAARALRAAMDNLPQRGTAWRALDEVDIEPAFQSLSDALRTLRETLEPLREAAPGFDACHLRANDQFGRLQRWLGEMGTEGEKVGSESPFVSKGDSDPTFVSSPSQRRKRPSWSRARKWQASKPGAASRNGSSVSCIACNASASAWNAGSMSTSSNARHAVPRTGRLSMLARSARAACSSARAGSCTLASEPATSLHSPIASRASSTSGRAPRPSPKNCAASSGSWCASSTTKACAPGRISPKPSCLSARSASSKW